MNTIALITAWWFLATPLPYHYGGGYYVNSGTQSPVVQGPLALGPYPTEEMCVQAERLAEPSNRKFWTPEQTVKWNKDVAAYTASNTRYVDWIKRIRKQNPKPGLYKMPDGVRFEIRKEHDYFSFGGSGGSGQSIDGVVVYNEGNIGSKWFPQISPYPTLASDNYTVNQPCGPVKGWYAQASTEGRR